MTFFKSYSHLYYYKDGYISLRDGSGYYKLINEENINESTSEQLEFNPLDILFDSELLEDEEEYSNSANGDILLSNQK